MNNYKQIDLSSETIVNLKPFEKDYDKRCVNNYVAQGYHVAQ